MERGSVKPLDAASEGYRFRRRWSNPWSATVGNRELKAVQTVKSNTCQKKWSQI